MGDLPLLPQLAGLMLIAKIAGGQTTSVLGFCLRPVQGHSSLGTQQVASAHGTEGVAPFHFAELTSPSPRRRCWAPDYFRLLPVLLDRNFASVTGEPSGLPACYQD